MIERKSAYCELVPRAKSSAVTRQAERTGFEHPRNSPKYPEVVKQTVQIPVHFATTTRFLAPSDDVVDSELAENVDTDPAEKIDPAVQFDPDLTAIIADWPTVPPAIRAGVIDLVRAGGGQQEWSSTPVPPIGST